MIERSYSSSSQVYDNVVRANLTRCHSAVKFDHARVRSMWWDLGDCVRGQLVLVNPGPGVNCHLQQMLAAESNRTGQDLELANLFELAHYAAYEWDRRKFVVAFGSVHYRTNRVACLYSAPEGQGLNLKSQHRFWTPLHQLLCVAL